MRRELLMNQGDRDIPETDGLCVLNDGRSAEDFDHHDWEANTLPAGEIASLFIKVMPRLE